MGVEHKALLLACDFLNTHGVWPSDQQLAAHVAKVLDLKIGRAKQVVSKSRHHCLIGADSELMPLGEAWLFQYSDWTRQCVTEKIKQQKC